MVKMAFRDLAESEHSSTACAIRLLIIQDML